MRLLLATAVLSAIPAMAAAQSSTVAPDASSPRPSIVLSLPPIGLPLPPIGLPLPQIGLPPATGRQPIAAADRSPRFRQERHRTGHGKGGRPETTIVFLPIYSANHAIAVDAATSPAGLPDGAAGAEQAAPATGRLRIDVRPDQRWQIYVDGYYLGRSEEFEGELELEEGPHRIEIRAAGYESLIFDVKIAPHRTVTFEGELKPVPPEPTPQPAPVPGDLPAAAPSTFYIIPGCYIGNVPPKDAGLPATCDPSRAVTVKP